MVQLVSDKTNLVAQILLDGAVEILGEADLQKVMPPVLPGSTWAEEKYATVQVGAFLSRLQEQYREPGSCGLALRIGRAAFRYGLKRFGDQVGFRSMEYRLLPAPRRLKSGLHTLARLFEEETDGEIAVSEDNAAWLWQVRRGFLCQGTPETNLECCLTMGLLQEFATWAGGGRFYRVVETECRASSSPACVYRIERKPLD